MNPHYDISGDIIKLEQTKSSLELLKKNPKNILRSHTLRLDVKLDSVSHKISKKTLCGFLLGLAVFV